ncbi:MAG: HK97 family phage prohead protease [Ruminococcus sp.]|nr:HK97 family phage prohead protease [Ruminococcus sp.]
MRIEERADGLHIYGYVNVTGKISRPVITPHGKCVETIEERAFAKAIEASGDIAVSVDHDKTHAYASTKTGTLKLKEDAIGLHADVLITDPTVIEMAKKGRIRGWSFGMYNVIDKLEQRAEGELPLRRISGLMLDHITLVVNKNPCYAATSVEYRADEGDCLVEQRAIDIMPELCIIPSENKPDLSDYEKRLEALKR